MIIVTLTTIPSRLSHVELTIDSFSNQELQPDLIVLNIPKVYNRNFELTDSHHKIIKRLSKKEKVSINRCTDYGPATKLLGYIENKVINEEDIVIICDDDRVYYNTFIKELVEKHYEIPECVICTRSQDYPIDYDGYCKIFCGEGGVLFTNNTIPRHQKLFNLNSKKPEYYVDDVWLSGFVNVNKTPIYKIKGFEGNTPKHKIPKNSHSLSTIQTKNVKKILNVQGFEVNVNLHTSFDREFCNEKCKKYFRKKYNIFR